MSTPEPIRAKGVTTYDLVGMSDEDFERMTARLVRLEHPAAFKPANVSDGGADMVLPKADRSGYERCWQAKRYPKNIRWDKCEKSLADARTHWNPTHYTFIFPRDLTVGEQKTFDEKFGSLDIKVDYWNGEELQARLTESDAGERVARTFFKDVELDRERTYQAIEAGGRLDDPEDAVDRLTNIGGFLAGYDAYFMYPAATHEEGGPAPALTPGTVLSFVKSDGKVQSRVDVVPRDEEAMERYGPEFRLEPAEGEAGARAAARLQEALRQGKEVEIEEGLDLTFTRMPPGFKEVVGQRMTGKIALGRPEPVRRPIPSWRAGLHASSGEGEADLDVLLTEMAVPPEGWDGALSGSSGGLTVTAMFRWREGEGGALRWNFHYTRRDAPVREQLAALAFMRAISAPGELVVSDLGKTGRAELRMPTPVEPLAPELRALLAFLEDVSLIEEWTGVQFDLPDVVAANDARDVAVVSDLVRKRGRTVTWQNIELTLPVTGLEQLRAGGVIRVEMTVAANVLGSVVDLGHTQLDLTGYVVTSRREAPGQPGYMEVRLEPGSEETAEVFERLVKERTPARRPPPAPPSRHGRRKRSGKKRGRRGRR